MHLSSDHAFTVQMAKFVIIPCMHDNTYAVVLVTGMSSSQLTFQ